MSHMRKQIRNAAVAALTGLSITGARVFPSRLRPLSDTDLPCLLVNTDDEQIETQGIGAAPLQERSLRLAIRAVGKLGTSLDDTLDTMLADVETVLAAQTLGGRAKSMTLESIAIEMIDDIDKPVGVATATYSVCYYTAAGSPGTAL